MDPSEYPPNSKQPIRKPRDRDAEPEVREKKVEKVIKNDVTKRKKSLGKRFTENFVQGDAHSVWSYVTFDVVLPAAQDLFADAISQAVERMIFGEARGGGRRASARNNTGHASYSKMHGSTPREEMRTPSRRARANHDFSEFLLRTRAEGEEVIERLFELTDRYDQATVADLYDLLGETSSFTDEKWGWTDMRGAATRRVGGGEYVLDLPRTVELK